MLDDIKKTLWATADKLRANMDAAEYKHLVLGLIFLKYVSDTFTARQAEVQARLQNPDDEGGFKSEVQHPPCRKVSRCPAAPESTASSSPKTA